MHEFSTYEYVVAKKNDAASVIKKVLAILGYILAGLVILVAFTLLHVPQFIAFAPIAVLALWFFTWRYLNVEYEYSMTSGVITFTKILGGRSRRQILELTIKEMKEIRPFEDGAKEHLETLGLKNDYVLVSDIDSPDVYYAVFENDKSELEVVYFEATKKALSIFKFYNPSSTKVIEVSK